MGPPNGEIPGREFGQAAAGEFALSYVFFHLGFTAWSLYIIPTIAIAYSVYVHKQSAFRFSLACQGVLKEYSKGVLGKIIDVLALFPADEPLDRANCGRRIYLAH